MFGYVEHMDNSNTRINLEEVWIEENIISSESIKKENDAIENPASMDVDEIAPKAAEVQKNTPDSAATAGKLIGLKFCQQCMIIIRGNPILQKKENGKVAHFCSEKCLNSNLCRTLPRLSYPRPIVRPQLLPIPSTSTSTTMKFIDPASLYVHVSNTEDKYTEIKDTNINESSSAIVPALVPVPISVPTDCRMIEEVTEKMEKLWKELPQDPVQADLVIMAKSLNDTKTDVEEKKSLQKSKGNPKLKRRLKLRLEKKYFRFGFIALKRWIIATNARIENDSLNLGLDSKPILMKTNPLFMTRDELHKCLVAFLKEINGACSIDIIYKIFLDVQKYLLQNKK